ncbi:MAG: hypothetical protein K8S15_05720 [Candidatus Aegiribacteria sp.]|nr:hypothetical protein [Candidatus Aegiribacteria sp.]
MNFRILSVILCLAGYSYASWLCPVYRTDISGQVEGESSDNLAVLKSWYVTIQPVLIENTTMLDYATWDYTVCENLVLVPPVSECSILICLDLGVVPELTRELEFFWVNGVLMEPRSMLGGYPNDMNILDEITESNYLSADSELHMHRYERENGAITRHELRSVEEYRSRFESEEDFRSAVPETRRFYADVWEIPCNGEEEIVVQVIYIVRGWTHITGFEPLRFSLCQPLLWNGPLNEGRIVFERPWMDTPEMWYVEFDGNELLAEDTHCYEVEISNLNIPKEEPIPFLLVEPDPVVMSE